MKLLHIDSSPLAGASASRELTRRTVERWHPAHPGTTDE
jgi:FMN-dependent NADH-azoreductase